jgi:AmiR/NasT family two-component response regulator
MSEHPVAPLNVLIIEDEAILVMDMEMVVEDAGHRVVGEAASVDELRDLRVEQPPNLAFIDVHLAQGSSGLDASAIVRDRWSDVCIVFVTANPGKVPDGHAGSHGVIGKPFTHKGMMAALAYLGQGISAPPPTLAIPPCFKPFQTFDA